MRFGRRWTFLCFGFLAYSLSAAWQEPSLSGWSGTAYREGGWFTYQMKEPYADGSLKFESSGPFILSPRYSAPIRKVVAKVVCQSDEPTRFLQLRPMADGAEGTVGARTLSNEVTVVKGASAVFALDFSAAEDVTAFILSLGSGSKGNWAVDGLCVFFGEKTAGEDEKLLEYAQQLPAPDSLRLVDFTANSLSLAVDPVTGAEGYRFEVFRLDGVPTTVCREDFTSVADLSSGWTYGVTNNVVLSQATGQTYPDTKTGEGENLALLIARGKSETDEVRAEIVSPLVEAAITSCSFVSKMASTSASSTCTDAVSVYGRSRAEEDWTLLAGPAAVSTSKAWTTNAVPAELNVRQVKFSFTADAATCRNCGLDTLRIVYGGNERRESVGVCESGADSPTAEFDSLETARYAVRAQAVGGATRRDSSWTDETVVDLSWASVTVTSPADVSCEQAGDTLNVSWQPVVGAASYRIELAAADDPEGEPQVVTTSATSVRLTLSSVGQYAVTVTAVSPGGKSAAAAEPVSCTAVLSAATGLAVEAIDRTAIGASWKGVPLAECYQVRLVRLGGEVSAYEYGWPTDGERCALPGGWEHEPAWDGDGWTSGGTVFPSLPYTGCWIASPAFDKPVTRLACKFKCASTAATTLEATRFVVSVAGASGEWEAVTNLTTASSLQELVLAFGAERDVRRIRLAADSVSAREPGKVALGTLSLTTGTETRTEVSSVSADGESATFRDLDPTGRYQVAVIPQPSDGDTLVSLSPTVDLARERFRAVGAIPVSQIRGGVYEQDFTCLTNVVGDLETRKLGLDYWQFFKGSGETEKILYTSATNRTTGGVYAFADPERTEAGFSLGTLATSTLGCSVGVAFVNDTGRDFSLRDFTFDWIQRNARAGANTNVLECLVTDGATGIGTEGTWLALETLVPLTAEEFVPVENRRRVAVADPLPLVVPAGKVLIVRWRHEKGAAGPMIGIDNVRLVFPNVGKGFKMFVR